MRATSKSMLVYQLVFFGSVWGISEATFGHLLHLLPLPGIAGDLMFVVGCLCMSAVWKRSGRIWAVPAVGMIAMLIKSVDLLLPGTPPAMVINPITALLAETLVFFAGCRLLAIGLKPMTITSALAISLTWRCGYFLIAFLGSAFLAIPNLMMQSPDFHFSFILFHGLTGAVMLWLAWRLNAKLFSRLEGFYGRTRPMTALLLFFLALAVEIVF
ncbi:MAG: hypothetical protein JXI33_09080 [Candidatus Aminicenantes bacterium]|nr:hypothetical protein [Candidatus Aminicenantes bacterium]